MDDYKKTRAYLLVDINKIINNINLVKQCSKSKVMAVVKADAYHLGIKTISKYIEQYVDCFGVATTKEAIELKENGINKEIITLSKTFLGEIELSLKNNISMSVSSLEEALDINTLANKLNLIANIHIKIDSGLHRYGFLMNHKSIEDIKTIEGLKNIRITGMFTHSPYNHSMLNKIEEEYQNFISFTKNFNYPKHFSNSLIAVENDKYNLDMMRLGILMYGYYSGHDRPIELENAIYLKSNIALIKQISKGETIGYDCTYQADKDMIIAVIPIGYADGIKKSLSNRGKVFINGKLCSVVGNVCMDAFMVDISDCKCKVYDEVEIIGDNISLDQISVFANTNNCDILCSINRINKVYKINDQYIFNMI